MNSGKFVIIVLSIILIFLLINYSETFSATTGTTFPPSQGELTQTQTNEWMFKPAVGYFGPVKIKYNLSDGYKIYPNAILLNIQRKLDQPTPISASTTFNTILTNNYTFTGNQLWDIIKVQAGLNGGEPDQNYDKIQILQTTGGTLEPSIGIYDMTSSFLLKIPYNTTVADSNVEFNFIDSNFNGKTIAPNDTTTFKPLGPFTIIFKSKSCNLGSVPNESEGCLACNSINRYANQGDKLCKSCNTGTFRTNEGTMCTSCPQGGYCPLITITNGLSESNITTQFILCPAGYYCPIGTISPNICPAGSFCPIGSSAIKPCPAGSYCPNATTFIPCTPGYYCPSSSISTTLCPAGKYCPIGSKSVNELPNCPAGYYCTGGNITGTETKCIDPSKCPIGSTSDVSCTIM